MDTTLALDGTEQNRQGGSQDNSREWKHPCGSTSILYLAREKGGRGLRSVEQEYQVTKVKVAVKLCRNDDQAMKMVR